MKREKDFWVKHWLEHFIILLLLFLIGLALLFCRRCHEQDYSGTLDRVPVPEVEVIEEPQQEVPIDEDVIVDRRRDAGGGCGEFCVTLAWESLDDLDLIVLQPNGRSISVYDTGRRTDSTTGGELDVDANLAGRPLTSAPVENITWQKPIVGNYVVTVAFYKPKSNSSTPFTLLITGNDVESKQFIGLVTSDAKKQTFNVSYPFSP